MTDSVEIVLDAHAELGEGALWHAQTQRLYWVDILQGIVHVYDPATNTDRAIAVGQAVGTVVPRRSGGLMLAVKQGFASLDLETEALTIVATPDDHKPTNRFNDGKCDPSGRFWAGTMDLGNPTARHAGTLYCLDAQHRLTPRLTQLGIPNGIVWTADKKTMYYMDTLAYAMAGYDYDDATGEVSNRRVLFTLPPEEGYPDGMCIDRDGMLWLAVMGSSRVFQWDPEQGKLLRSIKLPTRQIASCAFGGPNLDELYITSGTIALDAATLAAEPLAGALFKVRPGVQGVEAFEYAG